MKREELTREYAEQLVKQYGNVADAVRAVRSGWINIYGEPVSAVRAATWMREALAQSPKIYEDAKDGAVNRIKELLEEANIPIDAIGAISKVRIGSHTGLIKNKDGEAETKVLPNVSIQLTPSWNDGPKWPVVQPAKPVKIDCPAYIPQPRLGRTIVILPDIQVGFTRDIESTRDGLTETFTLNPIHDRVAIDVAQQVVADLQPDQIGHIGDFLDLTEMSRWLQHEAFFRTTQLAIDEGHQILAEFEAAGGEHRSPTFFVAGNHDRRAQEYIQKNARAAFNLRPALATPDDWPELTVPRLLRLNELNIEYCGEYPGSEKWLTDSLIVRHNPTPKIDYDASVIVGHTHKIKRETYSRRTQMGPQHHTLYEIGCLCRIEGSMPKGSLMSTVVPSDRGYIAHWAQGLAVVHIDDDGQHQLDMVEIHRGKAMYRGRVYAAKEAA